MKETKNLIPNVAEQLPVKEIYTDVLRPSFQALGKAGEGVMKFVALPFRFLGMTAEELEEKYKAFIVKALSKVGEEKRQSPTAAIAGPLLEHVKYVFDNEQEKIVEEMFAELLSNACNWDKCAVVHPSYVYVLQQITWLEAVIMKRLYEHAEDTDCLGVVFRSIESSEIESVEILSDEAEPMWCLEGEENVFFYYHAALEDELFGATQKQFVMALDNLQQLNLIKRIRLNKYKNSAQYSLEKHDEKHVDDFDPWGKISAYTLTGYAINLLGVCLEETH